MSDRLSRIEARLGAIDQALADIHIEARLGAIDQALADVQRRIDALEAGELRSPAVLRGTLAPAIEEPPLPLLNVGRPDVASIVSLVGRTFVVLGGAYLLRALTESGRLPGRGGVVLGLAYAVAWFGAADRAGLTHPLSGLFHGLAAVVISLPLLWEASAHFKLLSPPESAAILTLISGLALGVAWRRQLHTLAGVAITGSIVLTAGLVVATGRPLPFAAGLVALGACTLWLSDERGWSWLRWPPALAADLVAIVLVGRAIVIPPQEPQGAVIALLLAFVAVHAGSVAWRSLVGHERVRAFEMIQTPAAVGIGLIGALIVARGELRLVSLALGGLGLVGAAASYVAGFGVLQRRSDARRNVVFFSTLAVLLLLIGSRAILSGPVFVAWCGGLAVVAASLGWRVAEPQLSLHAAILALAMVAVSGTLEWAAAVWFTAGPWPTLSAGHVTTVTVAAICLAIPPKVSKNDPTGVPPHVVSITRFVLADALVIGIGGIAVWWLGPRVAGEPLDAGVLASMTTVVLAASAVAAAAFSRITPCVEFRWLVYPVLVVGGLKLVVDDFQHSSPATLFAALAVYGVALILAPRILRRS
jgi:hypothetical protein